MTFEEFITSAANDLPPAELSDELKALWYAEKGDWHGSHDIAQDLHNGNGSWIHAYLHREEGDLGNASYWYSRAGKPVGSGDLSEERHALIQHFLKD